MLKSISMIVDAMTIPYSLPKQAQTILVSCQLLFLKSLALMDKITISALWPTNRIILRVIQNRRKYLGTFGSCLSNKRKYVQIRLKATATKHMQPPVLGNVKLVVSFQTIIICQQIVPTMIRTYQPVKCPIAETIPNTYRKGRSFSRGYRYFSIVQACSSSITHPYFRILQIKGLKLRAAALSKTIKDKYWEQKHQNIIKSHQYIQTTDQGSSLLSFLFIVFFKPKRIFLKLQLNFSRKVGLRHIAVDSFMPIFSALVSILSIEVGSKVQKQIFSRIVDQNSLATLVMIFSLSKQVLTSEMKTILKQK